MRHVLGMLLAIGVAGVAAIAATTAMLNAPLRIGPTPATTQTAPPPAGAPGETKPGTSDTGKPSTRSGTPDAAKSAAKPGSGSAAAGADKEDEADKDPYEGIAPEDLPPDLQYSADSSVSFPTNI